MGLKQQIELPILNNPDRNPIVPGRDRKPDWLKVDLPTGETYSFLKKMMRSKSLHTVCEEAKCPNIAECWGAGTATFMVMGDTCTRSCGFCNIKTGKPAHLDPDEPMNVAISVKQMEVRHAVITSVDRDELPDCGAGHFAETIRTVRKVNPDTQVEVLIPDFKGNLQHLQKVIDAKPDVLNHNTETVPSLYRRVRPQARYEWTLSVLGESKRQGMRTKTGIILGMGETRDELLQTMRDLVEVGVDILTLGQYLQPTKNHLPVERWVTPEEFEEYKIIGEKMGFDIVESGPLVRSSYHAERHV